MRNRGNGKGGGIAACGLVPEDMGVSRKVLDEDYILQVALLDPAARGEVEKTFIEPYFNVDQGGLIPTVDDYRDVPLLEVRPPDVARYFVRVKPDVLARFAEEKKLAAAKPDLADRDIEDEFVYQNSHPAEQPVLCLAGRQAGVRRLPRPEPADRQDRRLRRGGRAVLSHGRHAGPRLDRPPALSDQGPRLASRRRAPLHRTERGPGPQRRLRQLPFGVRVPGRPRHLSRSSSPTPRSRSCCSISGTGFTSIPIGIHHRGPGPDDRGRTSTGSPPKSSRSTARSRRPTSMPRPTALGSSSSPAAWPRREQFQLMGITDTAMLRPQVFALQEGEVSIGLICSEKQAIDATLASLAQRRFPLHACGRHVLECPRRQFDRRRGISADGLAQRKWKARSGEQGAASSEQRRQAAGGVSPYTLKVTDKFGGAVATTAGQRHCDLTVPVRVPANVGSDRAALDEAFAAVDAGQLFGYLREQVPAMDYDRLRWFTEQLACEANRRNPTAGHRRPDAGHRPPLSRRATRSGVRC